MRYYYPKYYDENIMKNKLINQKQNLIVNSYGGSGTNWLRKNFMEKYNVTSEIWREKLCHYIRPVNDLPLKFGIYIYGDPLHASISELRRRAKNMSFFQMNFYKMMPVEYKNLKYSYPLMMQKMIEQMNNWKNADVNYPVILIKYEKIGEHITEIENILDLKFKFPFVKRKTDQKLINYYVKKYNLTRFNNSIKNTRETYNNMPDFQVIYPKNK